MEKVSVIIPVYNVEDYITQCVRSVMNQTYHNLEILIIEDGSEDKSLDICKELSQCDNRIQLITQRNAGVSEARNRGLAEATGEYVFFLDADDAIPQFLIERFIGQVQKKPVEIVMCNCKKLDNIQMGNLENELIGKEENSWKIGNGEESEEWFHVKYPEEMSNIGGKMFSKESIGELRFDKNLNHGEDTLFIYSIICKHVQIAYCCQSWYYYRMRDDSATHSDNLMTEKQYFECSRTIRDKEYEKNHISFALIWERKLIYQMVNTFLILKRSGDKEGSQSIKKQAVIERMHPLFQKARRDMKVIYYSSFFCYPLYIPCKVILDILQKILDGLWKMRQTMAKKFS